MLHRTGCLFNRTNHSRIVRTRLQLKQSRACFSEKKRPPPPPSPKDLPTKPLESATPSPYARKIPEGLGPSMGQGITGTGVSPPKLTKIGEKVPRPPSPFQAATVAMEKEKLQLQNTSLFEQAQLEQKMNTDYFSHNLRYSSYSKRNYADRKHYNLLLKTSTLKGQQARVTQMGDSTDYEGGEDEEEHGPSEPAPDEFFNLDDLEDDDAEDGPMSFPGEEGDEAFGSKRKHKKEDEEDEDDISMQIDDFETAGQEIVDSLEMPEFDDVDSDPMLGPLYEMILASKRRREMKRKRVDVLMKRFREKRKLKYGEKNKLRRTAKREAKKKFLEMATQSPDWFYYKEINFWIHRSSLEHPHIRACLPVLLDNPTWSTEQKRVALENMIKWIKSATDRTAEEKQKLTRVFQGVRTVPLRHSVDAYVEPDWKMPPTYEALIAAAEAAMPPDELTRKREPPVKAYPKPVQF